MKRSGVLSQRPEETEVGYKPSDFIFKLGISSKRETGLPGDKFPSRSSWHTFCLHSYSRLISLSGVLSAIEEMKPITFSLGKARQIRVK